MISKITIQTNWNQSYTPEQDINQFNGHTITDSFANMQTHLQKESNRLLMLKTVIEWCDLHKHDQLDMGEYSTNLNTLLNNDLTHQFTVNKKTKQKYTISVHPYLTIHIDNTPQNLPG